MDNLHQIDPAHSKQLEIRHNLGAQELVVFRTIFIYHVFNFLTMTKSLQFYIHLMQISWVLLFNRSICHITFISFYLSDTILIFYIIQLVISQLFLQSLFVDVGG